MQSPPKNTGYFVRRFAPHKEKFVVIGGTAMLLQIERRVDKRPRKTDDLDIVTLDLSEDGQASDFLIEFGNYVNSCGYECAALTSGKAQAYRFTKPTDPLAPSQLEIATRRKEGIPLARPTQRLEEFEMSSIVCEPHFVNLLKVHREYLPLDEKGDELLPVASIPLLVVMKAYAFENLSVSANSRDRNKAVKHLRDIIRMGAAMNDSDVLSIPLIALAPLQRLLENCTRHFTLERLTDCDWHDTAEALERLFRNQITVEE
ncbi:hypothetical protein WDW37_11590 [Bdellovibrionota bacterium FG-1]